MIVSDYFKKKVGITNRNCPLILKSEHSSFKLEFKFPKDNIILQMHFLEKYNW